MFEQAITSTKIIKSERLSAADLDKLIFYCCGEQACPCIVLDSYMLPPIEKMLNELRKIHSFEVVNRVFPDPKVDDIMAMVDELQGKEEKEGKQGKLGKPVNMVIGIGGGSAMDLLFEKRRNT